MKPIVLILFLSLFAAGCGPSVHSLVQAKHYREAVCAAHDGAADELDYVARALDKDADIYVHVHTVSEAELQTVLGLDTPAALDRGRMIRVSLQSNILPLDNLELETKFATQDGKTASIPVGWKSLAWLTNEKLPPNRIAENYVTGENLLKAAGVLVTAGFLLLFTKFHPYTYEVDPPLWEFKQSSPRAFALHETTRTGGCTDLGGNRGVGKKCTFYHILDSVSKEPVALQIDARYVSMRQTGKSAEDSEERCLVPRTVQLPLGTPQEIEKVTRERFGDRMQPVRALIRSK